MADGGPHSMPDSDGDGDGDMGSDAEFFVEDAAMSGDDDDSAEPTDVGQLAHTRARGRLSVVLKRKQFGVHAVCHVCGQKGHNAGFKGAVYQGACLCWRRVL